MAAASEPPADVATSANPTTTPANISTAAAAITTTPPAEDSTAAKAADIVTSPTPAAYAAGGSTGPTLGSHPRGVYRPPGTTQPARSDQLAEELRGASTPEQFLKVLQGNADDVSHVQVAFAALQTSLWLRGRAG